jgi:hypothetical protein
MACFLTQSSLKNNGDVNIFSTNIVLYQIFAFEDLQSQKKHLYTVRAKKRAKSLEATVLLVDQRDSFTSFGRPTDGLVE